MAKEEQVWMIRLDETPLGHLDLFFSAQGLTALEITAAEDDMSFIIPGLTHSDGEEEAPSRVIDWINDTIGNLASFFQGLPLALDDVPLDLRGTPFQLRVWQELGKIPPGETVSYQELARRLGNPKAARAVGQACGANPLPLIVPCHRVIAANGTLGGFSSGLEHKRWLLAHEHADVEGGPGTKGQ
jgi:O-6-methylguanine DNA methyltransferase